MTFSEAMAAVQNGLSVRRNDWNRPFRIFATEAKIGDAAVPGVWMEMRDGRIGAYVPSQCDMLGDDWTVTIRPESTLSA